MKNLYWQHADQLTMSKPVIKVELEIRVIEFQVQHLNPLQVPKPYSQAASWDLHYKSSAVSFGEI